MTNRPGSVIWITGLSGAGKTTLARELVVRMRALDTAVVMLDGDDLREIFGMVETNTENYDREGRLLLALRYARMCQIIADQGVTVVIATISLFREVHIWNRAHISDYFEVYLKVPLEEVRRRDPKGIYQRFDAGELEHIAGLDLDIDEPENPDVVVEFKPEKKVSEIANDLLSSLRTREPL